MKECQRRACMGLKDRLQELAHQNQLHKLLLRTSLAPEAWLFSTFFDSAGVLGMSPSLPPGSFPPAVNPALQHRHQLPA